MQPLSGRQQQQLGLLMGRSQPETLDAARVAALLNGQSVSNLQPGLGASLGGLGGQGSLNLSLGSLPSGMGGMQQAAQPGGLGSAAELALLQHAGLFPTQLTGGSDRDLGGLRNVGKTRSADSRSSSAYASRHQAAEQRRRTRINERLELLRKLVPHAERANTACFLEEVIKYIEHLKRRTLELENMVESATGKPVAKSLALQAPTSVAREHPSDSRAPSPGRATPPATQVPAADAPSLTATLAPPQPEPLQPPQLHSSIQQQQQLLLSAQGPQQVLLSNGSSLTLNGNSLSLGSGLAPMSLAHLTMSLPSQQGAQLSLSSHRMSHQLSELQTMQVMQSLQQQQQQQQLARAAGQQSGGFHPPNSKAFLQFNEDLFGGLKPELHAARSSLMGAVSATPSTSLQMTATAHLPADSNTLLAVETVRKANSGSPGTSEESGVPLKKRRVLML